MKTLLILGTAVVLAAAPAWADSLGGDLAYSEGDFRTAYREWSAAAAQGDPSAMAALGTLFDTGNGVPQDFAAALGWYRRAAEAGSARGMFNVGAMYDNGRGTPTDRAAAVRWYTMAANQGHGRAAFALGLIYRSGDGVPRNRDAAVRFFRIAATAGIPAARTNLALLQSSVPPAPAALTLAPRPAPQPGAAANGPAQVAEVQKAVLSRAPLDARSTAAFAALVPSQAEQAANDGRLAQYNIGYAFEHGHGVARDDVQSYVYYLRAAASANAAIKAAALRGAADVGTRLSPAQHVQARDLLLEGGR